MTGGEGLEKETADGLQPEPASGRAPTRKSQPRTECAVCGVKLSLYNPGPNCWNHTMGWPWRGPSAKPRFD